MAETTTSETKRARLERELYDNIKNLIIRAIQDGGSDSAISIHSAMAHVMADVITDIKGPYMSQNHSNLCRNMEFNDVTHGTQAYLFHAYALTQK